MSVAPPPLVTVAIPAFGHARFIEACLDSVAAQTYANLELVLIDDASPDETLAIARAWAERSHGRFQRIDVSRNTLNRGAPTTLNRCIARAQGEYIAFLNSDDRYAPDRIATCIEAMTAGRHEFAFTGIRTIDESGAQTTREPLCHKLMLEPAIMAETWPSVSWAMMGFQIGGSTGNFVVSARLARTIGGFAQLSYCHDWDFALHAAFHSEPLFIPARLYDYRLHGLNSFRSLTAVAASDTVAVLKAHFRRVYSRQPPNPLCPAPQNWPGLHDPMIQALGYTGVRDQIYRPYRPHHRTIDLSAV